MSQKFKKEGRSKTLKKRETQRLNCWNHFEFVGVGKMEVEHRKGHYGVLGVNFSSSDDEIRRAYRKLAMQWHPDKWSRTPSLVDAAKHKFQQIQQAYSVLSDRTKRTLYDAGLHDEEEDDEVEGFSDFLQEMVTLVNDVRKEEKTYYSFEEVRSMFWEMAQGYEIPEWTTTSCGENMVGGNGGSNKSHNFF